MSSPKFDKELTIDQKLNEAYLRKHRLPPYDELTLIGLYGIPGCGKTYLLRQLKQKFGGTNLNFFDGSEVIDENFPGGLNAFHKAHEAEKVKWRGRVIDSIWEGCAEKHRIAVVAGHFMFWSQDQEAEAPVFTERDLENYSHIIYLDVPAETIAQRRSDDVGRFREPASEAHLAKWQEAEKAQLRRLCRENGKLFSLAPPHPTLLEKVSVLLEDFRRHTGNYNLSQAKRKLDEIMATSHAEYKTLLVMDADKTIAAEDTGALFWGMVPNSQQLRDEERSVEAVFSSSLGYSYVAFRQAMLLYEEAANDQEFEDLCEQVAKVVKVHPEMAALLRLAGHNHVGAVVVSCGLRRVWEKVLQREGLFETVKVIGGGRISDGFVMTASVKGAIVTRLKHAHGMYVWAFGDSPLDMSMLSEADEAIIVVGEEETRSKTMNGDLGNAIDKQKFRARQALLPSKTTPRLDTARLPLVDLTSHEFTDSIIASTNVRPDIQVFGAAENAGKLLATPMRNALVAGPDLREAHRRAGWYLAIEFLPAVVGLEENDIVHVQAHHTCGYQLSKETKTTIVALMRGGESMAQGVNDAFPRAMFVHASNPDDIKHHHVLEQNTVILVDSVVNTGKSVIQFVQQIRKLHATIRIIVVAGVVQAQCMSEDGFKQELARHRNMSLVYLRVSQTKFTGTHTTDTGNRLFNTTHLA